MKKCPYCAEEIQDDAKKCRFCGEWLKIEAGKNVINKDTNGQGLDGINPRKGGFFSNLFRGRLRRLDYFLFSMLTLISVCIINSIVLTSLSYLLPRGIMTNNFFTYNLIVCMVIAYFFVLTGVVRRFHDIKMSGYWVFTLPVPLVGIVFALILLFKKGTEGRNDYGEINSNGFFKRIFNLQ